MVPGRILFRFRGNKQRDEEGALPEDHTDERLLARARGGDERAFVVLYERHREPVFRFAFRLLGSAEAAEDVAHDCFLALMTQPLRFDPSRASLRTYLCGAARNLSLKHLRTEGRELRGEPVPEQVIDGPALHGLLDHEMACQVREAVSALPPLQREVVVLVEYESFSIAEAAEVVGAEVGTVKARLHRARRSLRLRLASLRTEPALAQTGDEE